MKYKVLNDQELRAMRGLLEDGIYDYEVMDAVEMFAGGNPDAPMMQLTLKVIDKKGNPVALKDWLSPGEDNKFVWKIKAFLDSCGRSDKYDGELTIVNCLGAKGKLRTRTGKNKRGEDQIFIAAYMAPGIPTAMPGVAAKPFVDSDIKF